MIHTMFGCLNRQISDLKLVQVEEGKVTKAVYRDELTNKTSPLPSKGVKKSVRFADSEPTILGEDLSNEKKDQLGKRSSCAYNSNDQLGERREGMRVKVKMTKEEAARLLSKCKQGGVLEFKDVARELVALPLNRVSLVSNCTNNDPPLKQSLLS